MVTLNQKAVLTNLRHALSGSSPSTIAQFCACAERFMYYSDNEFTREAVVGYIQKLDREGYAAGTRKLHYNILKRIFAINGVEWPFGKRPPSELPVEVAEWDVERIPIKPAEVCAMIVVAKPQPAWAAILALSTTYGIRRVELLDLRPECLLPGIIRIRTAKHGRQREHLIPSPIQPYLNNYPFGQFTEYKLSELFHKIRRQANLPKLEGGGWHSIRRTLDTIFLVQERLPLPIVQSFMRWKKSSREMPLLYACPEILGEGGDGNEAASPIDVDRQVFAVHPFLKLWEQRG